jgi:hypothetical protein
MILVATITVFVAVLLLGVLQYGRMVDLREKNEEVQRRYGELEGEIDRFAVRTEDLASGQSFAAMWIDNPLDDFFSGKTGIEDAYCAAWEEELAYAYDLLTDRMESPSEMTALTTLREEYSAFVEKEVAVEDDYYSTDIFGASIQNRPRKDVTYPAVVEYREKERAEIKSELLKIQTIRIYCLLNEKYNKDIRFKGL